jgi:hypothetical protein
MRSTPQLGEGVSEPQSLSIRWILVVAAFFSSGDAT